ncbi:MAG: HD domain-containing protein, partial [Longimicrobiales bacterium]|nr:HD domain-containing protein [Longimicrobiales bacterium]
LSILSYSSVRNQLLRKSRGTLGDMTKNAGLALAERLQFLENSARLVLIPIAQRKASGPHEIPTFQLADGEVVEFEAAVVIRDGQEPRALFGEMSRPRDLDQEERAHLEEGRSLVRLRRDAEGAPEILMALEARDADGSLLHLWTRLNLDFLWRTASGYSTLPSTAGICILGDDSGPLYCTLPDEEAFLSALQNRGAAVPRAANSLPYTIFEWNDETGEEYLAATRNVFLRPQFFLPSLTVSVSQSLSSALSTMESFRSSFWGVIIVGLVVVALLSNIQIRKNLGPLEELRKGTQRLAEGDFRERVSVESRDEFGELAGSFNTMATRLESQFHALETIGEIDRSILSALDSNRIIETALLRVEDLLPCDKVSVCRLDWFGAREGRLRVSEVGTGTLGPERKVVLEEEDLVRLGEAGESFLLERADSPRQFFGGGPADREIDRAIMVPLRLSEGLAGYLAVGKRGPVDFSETDVSRMRQIGKQISIALSNAWLLEEIERISWGALTALARAIDAKSPWTSGHSERVASLSVAVGRGMGLPESALTDLQRGGLVHDIGKIAVPGRILDKEGKLTPEERLVIQSHPEEGVRILEPISAMEGILPMVLHHHEAWDGSGYPMGLAGEIIPLEARIMAVADQFDALSSDRPYRSGLSLKDTVDLLRRQSGYGLDPKVVDAFLALLDSGELPVHLPTSAEVEP